MASTSLFSLLFVELLCTRVVALQSSPFSLTRTKMRKGKSIYHSCATNSRISTSHSSRNQVFNNLFLLLKMQVVDLGLDYPPVNRIDHLERSRLQILKQWTQIDVVFSFSFYSVVCGTAQDVLFIHKWSGYTFFASHFLLKGF